MLRKWSGINLFSKNIENHATKQKLDLPEMNLICFGFSLRI